MTYFYRSQLTDNIYIGLNTFYKNILKTDNCWPWQGSVGQDGYGYFQIKVNNKRIAKKAHRINYAIHNQRFDLLESFNRNEVVMHKCNNKLCCNPNHLELGTHQKNSKDALEQGLYKTGESHSSSKLSNQQVLLIKNNKMPDQYYSNLFGVSKSLIQKIRLGSARKHG